MTWGIDLIGTRQPSSIVGGENALGVLAERAALVRGAGIRIFLVTDKNVEAAWGGSVMPLLSESFGAEGMRVLTPGEASKSAASAVMCWDWLSEVGARRDDIVVAFGGGMVGDLAGFVAATYLRGVRLWQVPTTLLSQVDSSVGGKVAVNLPNGKNLVGAFHQPELVVVYPGFLSTLSVAEYASGLGEVVKYALLSDGGLLDMLDTKTTAILAREPTTLSHIVEQCVTFKAVVVGEDETDRGRRAILNLGHTFGHALESTLGYNVLPHGAAVSLGLVAALAVSETAVGLSESVRPRVVRLLAHLGLPTRMPDLAFGPILEAMGRDKKATADGIGFVCLCSVGTPQWGVRVDEETLRGGLEAITA